MKNKELHSHTTHSTHFIVQGWVILFLSFIGTTAIAQPTLTTTNTAICAGGSVNLNSLISTNATNISWFEQPPVVAIAAGDFYNSAVLSNGSAIHWGFRIQSLGNIPSSVVDAKAIAAGNEHILTLLGNGTVVNWGSNFYGQLNIPNTVVNAKAIAAGGYHSLALLNNGSVVGWGRNSQGQTTIPNTVVNATAIAAGDNHSLALLSNGTVVGWGNNALGQTTIPNTVANATAIAARANHNLALLSNGTVVGWGSNASGQTTIPNTVVNATAIAAGYSHNLALLSNGTVIGWGDNTYGQTTIPNNVVGAKAIAAGNGHSIALLDNGSVVGWGYNSSGQTDTYNPLPFNTTLISPTTTKTYYVVVSNANGSKTYGSVTVTVNPVPTFDVPSVSNPSSINGTNGSVLVGVTGGTAPYTYLRLGSNTTNQTGLFTGLSAGTYTFSVTDNNNCSATASAQVIDPPTLNTSNTTICGGSVDLNSLITTNGSTVSWSEKPQAINIAAGDNHSLALLSNGTVIGWGYNGNGQTTIPNTIVGATAIAAGDNHSLALLNNGTVVGWGDNSSGQTNTPNTVVGVTAITAGRFHSLALLNNGTVVGWGDNTYGQTIIPNTVIGAKTIESGYYHNLVLSSNGTVIGWGDNTYTQTTTPNTVVRATAIAAGGFQSLALLNNGSVISWGNNRTVPNTVVGAKAIAAGSLHSLAVLSNGSVVGWGLNNYGQTTIPNTVVGARAIAAGGNHSLAVLSNGSVVGWGLNNYGQVAGYDPLPLSNTTVSPTTTKTYYVVVTNTSGDKAMGSVTVTVNSTPIIGMPSVTNAQCFGGSDGQVTLLATGGTGNITYSINPNIGNQNSVGTFTGLTAQTYTFTATDANGCSAASTTTVTQPANISFSPHSVTNVKCFGSSDGQVVVSAMGGTGNINYTISPNIGTQSPVGTFTGLTPQTYTFTATDGNGCSNITTATITQPAVLSLATPSVSNPSSANGTDARVFVGVKGGTSPYTYQRSGSNTTNQTGLFTGLSAGTYSFTATDNNGCPAVTTTAQVIDPPTLTTNNTILCGSSSINLNSLITTNASSITWSEKPQATAIAAGNTFNLALLSDGSVIGWGDNASGQTTIPNTAVGVKAIAAGNAHSLALLSNGSVIAWGQNNFGQTTVPNTVVGARAIAAGSGHGLALLDNGSVIGWGANGNGQTTVPNTVVNTTVIGTGLNHSLAILSNGSGIGWGTNGNGQSNVPNTVVDAKAMAGGLVHTLALLANGSVIGWGTNSSGQLTIPNTVVNAKAIATNANFSLALLSNGSVVGWGNNANGQITIPNTVVNATAISAGGAHGLALLSNGSVIGWGNNSYNQSVGYDALPLSNTIVSPTSTKTYYVVVTNANGDKTTGSVTVTVNPVPTPPATTTNNALSFDGTNDCVQITKCSGSLFAGGDALTIEYWFKGSSNQSAVRMQDNNGYIVAGWNGQHVLSNDGGTPSGINIGAGYNDGNWHHIAMTWQRGGLFTSYLDGNQVAQRAASNTPLPAFNSGVYLGAYLGISEFMNGTLDEVRVWTTARTQAQIQANMSVCTLLDQSNLLMYYRFDHGTANTTNTTINTLLNTVNSNELTGALNGFSLSSTASNWTTGKTCNTVLPVEIVDFSGKNTEGGNLLTWTTANEQNNKGFGIERLAPNGQWVTLGFVNAKSKAANYEFIDKEPLSTSYYRLRQLDNDGKTALSKIISISIQGKQKLSIYPNPASNLLTVDGLEGDYQIFNLLGQVILRGQAKTLIDISNLSSGSYLLKVGTEQVKFIKQE
ncbi:MAG: T9SS type A sorting domain-containing protein [Saprospiraceae bacterium]|nr:T9SS type A sorting domain-containing protein [Saprospiraceae bacterium]